MLGTKTISDLITSPSVFKSGRINIIEAPVSSGKTRFALTVLPIWAESPEKVLYLIDTNNGEYSIQRNILARTVDRKTYALLDYNEKYSWGELINASVMPVMTYSGFAYELLKHDLSFRPADYKFIVCDEMQNLVHFQDYPNPKLCAVAEAAIDMIAQTSNAIIVAISATPEAVRERFKELCYDVPFDKSDIWQLETFHEVPFADKVETLLDKIAADPTAPTGILYTEHITDMKRYIDYANRIGIRADGFWSIQPSAQKEHPFSREQWELRETVLREETIPQNLRLLVINKASETCIKIDHANRIVDYMIVDDENTEVRIQARGRYHGDLKLFYYKDAYAHARKVIEDEGYLNKRLYTEDLDELCRKLNFRNGDGSYYKWPTVKKKIVELGYILDYKQDSKRGGKRYYVISKDTNSEGTI